VLRLGSPAINRDSPLEKHARFRGNAIWAEFFLGGSLLCSISGLIVVSPHSFIPSILVVRPWPMQPYSAFAAAAPSAPSPLKNPSYLVTSLLAVLPPCKWVFDQSGFLIAGSHQNCRWTPARRARKGERKCLMTWCRLQPGIEVWLLFGRPISEECFAPQHQRNCQEALGCRRSRRPLFIRAHIFVPVRAFFGSFGFRRSHIRRSFGDSVCLSS